MDKDFKSKTWYAELTKDERDLLGRLREAQKA